MHRTVPSVHPPQLAEIGLPTAGDDRLPLVIGQTDVSGSRALDGGRHFAVADLAPVVSLGDVSQKTAITIRKRMRKKRNSGTQCPASSTMRQTSHSARSSVSAISWVDRPARQSSITRAVRAS
ncbi:hypothetical protein AGR7C_Lc100054 [Agrobacterium deltaense Zutra 3/1]|uniref:Uncharacterized protein n=1 Tax=Agrobacterium deltaense Zutra 3/1 TaxID=1183427 RepID=A0A1S7QQT0_9HYPH|nr:hypothetical protein AGR7C_Lc100054 [Agrobacterium deltaense Zutra 3/1]